LFIKITSTAEESYWDAAIFNVAQIAMLLVTQSKQQSVQTHAVLGINAEIHPEWLAFKCS